MEPYSISVIIPNYNGKKLLEKNLPSVFAALKQNFSVFELIVVDDASTDDSIVWLKKHGGILQYIPHPRNKGFSSACNTGIRAARNELIMLLNSDIVLPPDFFEGLIGVFDNEDAFGVMSRIIGPDDAIQDMARHPKWQGGKMKFANFYQPADPEEPIPTIYLSGANAIIRADKLKQLGGFNELLNPFYCEDMELCIRAWRMGWSCWYCHARYCIHDESATTRSHFKRRKIKAVYFRNRCLVHYLHLNGPRRFLWAGQILFELLFSWLILRLHVYSGVAGFLSRIAQADVSADVFRQLENRDKMSIAKVFGRFRKLKDKTIQRTTDK